MKKSEFFLSRWLCLNLILLVCTGLYGQNLEELNSGWKCKKATEVKKDGEAISNSSFSIDRWMPAIVPGTVLTTLLKNNLVPDPDYGMNNEKIPDIFNTGNDYYTYWFALDFSEKLPGNHEEVWLEFRGVNYGCNIFLNGHPLNQEIHKGMFLRQTYRVTPFLSRDGNNRLAVIVYPPDPPGNPNGGQGGDGWIGRNVAHQYVAGWDWIQPVRDRNTGIWDKVFIERTGTVNIKNPHVVTRVTGIRYPEDRQAQAIIQVTTELENPSDRAVPGILQYTLDGKDVSVKITLPAHSDLLVHLPDFTLENPRLWWPNGYGPQNLYDLKLEFLENGISVSDSQRIRFGVREITTSWNPFTRSREFAVNGQKIFIKGGNWIISDAMLRFSKERYDAEVRFHRDANLNLIRIWGGAITERPEFYDACDKYGILVWQEFWMSGDCNGRWQDPMKKDDQWQRRKYPDDHDLFIRSAVDMVKMIRNHPSLFLWCGGNEITPPDDINRVLMDTLNTELDGTRLYIESSTSGELYDNFKGSTGDGPYGIQHPEVFWNEKSYPFNPELGSVGTGDFESLKRFIPDSDMVVPGSYKSKTAENLPPWWAGTDPVWRYHKYLGYDDFIRKYGNVNNVQDFARIAQVINYDQYRALAEGFTSHMWEWYTGFIIWKTQNPWTALRGQLYDWYLDPNACLYGLHHGSEPFHLMLNPVDGMIMIANNTFTTHNNLMVTAEAYDISGHTTTLYHQWVEVSPTTVKKVQSIERGIHSMSRENGMILSLKMMDANHKLLSENLYWLADSLGDYPILQHMTKAPVQAKAVKSGEGKIDVTLTNDQGNPLAFFIRLSLVDPVTHERILPVFYSDNYVSVEPGENRIISIQGDPSLIKNNLMVQIEGWNVDNIFIPIK